MRLKRFAGSVRWVGLSCGLLGLGPACDGVTGTTSLDPGPLLWSREAFILAPMWGGDERRFFVAAGGIYALDPESGSPLWDSPGGRVGPEFQVIGDLLVVEQGGLKGVRAADGTAIWDRPGAPVGGVLGTVSEGVVSTDGEVLAAFDLGTGRERWRVTLEPGGGVNMAVGEGVACTERLSPRGDAVVQCFRADDGTPIWTRRMESAAWIAIVGGLLVLAGGEIVAEPGWVAVKPATGETVWKRTDLPVLWAVHERGRGILVACDSGSGRCFAVRASDGSVVWEASIGADLGGMIAASGRLLVFAPPYPLTDTIHVIDLETGARRGAIVSDHPGVTGFCSGPAVSGDRMLVYGCGGFLLAYRLP